jgi:hypothetical protein
LLVTVADADGLSYYSDPAVGRLLGMSKCVLAGARRDLCQAGLIVYCNPLYQVLSLDTPEAGIAVRPRRSAQREGGEAISIGEVLRQMIGGGE